MDTKKLLTLALVSAALMFASCSKEALNVAPGSQNQILESSGSEQVIDGQYIVTLRDKSVAVPSSTDYITRTTGVFEQISALLLSNGLGDIELDHVYSSSILGFAAKLTANQVEQLSGLEVVKSIDKDVVLTANVTTDGFHTKAAAQQASYGVRRVGHASGVNKRVFVLDTGVDLDHPDLNVNTDLSKAFTSSSCNILSILFGCPESSDTPNDGHGHGTHVAGIIAAIDNNIGVLGVAAGAEVIGVKVLSDAGSGSTSDIIQGVDYVAATAKVGEVANMSLGGPATTTALDNAVRAAADKGVLFTLAAGNDSQDASLSTPARANGANIYTISAMDANDVFAFYSNFGNPPVDYCMPGSGIYSTFKDGGYTSLSGTSMAAPHMAGVLTIRGKNFNTDGTVRQDTDGNPDLIAVL